MDSSVENEFGIIETTLIKAPKSKTARLNNKALPFYFNKLKSLFKSFCTCHDKIFGGAYCEYSNALGNSRDNRGGGSSFVFRAVHGVQSPVRMNMFNVAIREIEPAEYDELENFLYEAIYIPDGVPKPPREILKCPELQVYVKAFGTRAADCGFVAEHDGKIVGACWARIMNDYGHIDDETPSLALSVLKDFRRRGIATALLKKISARLAEKNFNRVSLSVQKENSAAVVLYRKLQFEIIALRGEEYLMIKKLTV